MTSMTKTLLSTAFAAGALALSSGGASATMACNGNVCWHVHERYEYPARAHVVIHEDDWRPAPRARVVIREHEGRGYWRGGTWVAW